MSRELLKKYAGGKLAESDSPTGDDADGIDDLHAFGLLRRSLDRALMLELRHKDGQVRAFSYAWLERAEFDPSEGITLFFGGKSVRIIGRNLNAEVRPNVRLFAALVRHRISWIQEADGATLLSSPRQAIVVESISLKT